MKHGTAQQCLDSKVIAEHYLVDLQTVQAYSKNIQNQLKRQRQDHPVNQDHQHINVHDDMKIPPKWREIIDCRI